MSSFETVRQATADAIRQSLSEGFQWLERPSLFGFALCTHDDVDSVYHVYATRDWVNDRESDYPGIGFIPVEWTQASEDTPFLSVSKLLREWALFDAAKSDRNYDRDRAIRFGALVEAMKDCRTEDLFHTETVLLVNSTDPDASMEKLALEAVKQLNSSDIEAEFYNVVGVDPG